MWSHGIDFHHLHAAGFGQQGDVADNETVTGSALNRRVEIRFKLPLRPFTLL